MISKLSLRTAFFAGLLLAMFMTVRSNVMIEAPRSIFEKTDIEAVVTTGHGQVIGTEKPYRFARKNMVTFSVIGCNKPVYVLPGALHNEAYQYLTGGSDVDLNQYEKAMSYVGDIRLPVAVVKLYLEKLNYDVRHFFGAKPIRHGSYGLFFFVPRGCDLRGKFAWEKLWLDDD